MVALAQISPRRWAASISNRREELLGIVAPFGCTPELTGMARMRNFDGPQSATRDRSPNQKCSQCTRK